MEVLLRGGPCDGRVVVGGGEAVICGSCLYERTFDIGRARGRDLRVYQHRPDCCQPYGRGAEDRCE
ncbi:hypothetical protein [Micromonospora echinaurantiaca]|uniref:hypothetical protein n=1 Tax=Micromonospora echinaurantiaca TaxID=47857 RepID=UPI000B5B0CB6|nr:hypothetical protein [Micromonospora echinaurantiaca]